MPSYQEIYPQLIDLLGPFVTDGQEITEDTELVADLGLSSLKIMDLLLEVEDRFDVSVPSEGEAVVRYTVHYTW